MENKKTYQPNQIEQSLYQNWEQQGYFKPSGDSSEGNYCVMIPPPNVTGSLHMGHAFQHTLMDTMIRYQRMQGKNTLWQVGTDHAGIATQMVVERQLAAEGETSRQALGRDAFLNKVWDWKDQYGGKITQQMRRMGVSVDWERERFTMDEGFTKAVNEVFVRLHQDGLIYRGKRLVNWDPKLGTAISDLEVNNVEKKGHMWYVRYPLAGTALTSEGKDYLMVATTRPETLLGDSAVAVHPQDPRFMHLVGQELILPLTNRRIPIIADEHADLEKGSGCVKITPAHDFNDYEVGQRHRLKMYNIMTKDAAIAQQAETVNADGTLTGDLLDIPQAYQGLDRFAARKQIVADLDRVGLLEKVDDHTLMVPYGDRGGVVIEPLLTDQWYVHVEPMAKTAREVVASGQVQFVPQQYENMYNAWMNDVQDWCISRQLWWGHRIPAWYDDQGQVYVGRSEAEVRQTHKLADSVVLKQDEDVLDTWFSSALWTFGTLGWPDATEALKKFHPTDVLFTGFDIIFFWVARMIMMTTYFIKDEQGLPQVPFKKVYMTGLIRDEQGQKMSKSKGNVIDPLDMIDGIDLESLVKKRTESLMQPKLKASIEKNTRKAFSDGILEHGTDALRFTLASLASTGRDIHWDMNRLEGYRNFCNKLFQASNYVLMHTENQDCGFDVAVSTLEKSSVDLWIEAKLNQTIVQVEEALAQYRFDLMANVLYDFTWNEFCAWYLELTKPVLKNGTEAQKVAARHTLLAVLERLLRLMHPVMPYITESLWHDLKPLMGLEADSIMIAAYPKADDVAHTETAVAQLEQLKQWITAVRNIRAEYQIAPSKPLTLLFQGLSDSDETVLSEQTTLLQDIARIEDIQVLAHDVTAPLSAKQVVGQAELMVPMAEFIDVATETARVSKQCEKLEQDLQRVQGKLNNANFVAKAPEAVVAKEQAKCDDLSQHIEKLNQQLKALANIEKA